MNSIARSSCPLKNQDQKCHPSLIEVVAPVLLGRPNAGLVLGGLPPRSSLFKPFNSRIGGAGDARARNCHHLGSGEGSGVTHSTLATFAKVTALQLSVLGSFHVPSGIHVWENQPHRARSGLAPTGLVPWGRCENVCAEIIHILLQSCVPLCLAMANDKTQNKLPNLSVWFSLL